MHGGGCRELQSQLLWVWNVLAHAQSPLARSPGLTGMFQTAVAAAVAGASTPGISVT